MLPHLKPFPDQSLHNSPPTQSIFNTYSVLFFPMGELICIPIYILIYFSLLLFLLFVFVSQYKSICSMKAKTCVFITLSPAKQGLGENRNLIQFVKWIKYLTCEWMTKIYSVSHDTWTEGRQIMPGTYHCSHFLLGFLSVPKVSDVTTDHV